VIAGSDFERRKPSMDEEKAKLVVQTALPIDAIDQITGIIADRTAILVWVDLQDRPDTNLQF